MGWIRTQLPGVVGLQGENPDLIPKNQLPILGSSSSPMITYYHQGSALGYYSVIFLFPESEFAVVMLTNSIPLNNTTDWIAQVYINETTDYLQLARQSRQQKLAYSHGVMFTMNRIRQEHPGEEPHPLSRYIGVYQNSVGNFCIEVRLVPENNSEVEMRFQGRDSQANHLCHLYSDVFE